jgi:flagellar protein FliS
VSTTAAFATARNRYASNSVTTASPARLLVMLYDRLVRDVVTAQEALVERDVAKVNSNLQHAQQIVLELRTSLDTTAWDGAAGLADLYTFLYNELVAANIEKSAARVQVCRELVEPLRDAWTQAAAAAPSACA